MKIKNLKDLALYFQRTKNMSFNSVYVDGEIRREWMLANIKPYLRGKIREITFEDMGDDVWRANLELRR